MKHGAKIEARCGLSFFVSLILSTSLSLAVITAESQIEQGHWMIGGSIRANHGKFIDSKTTNLNVDPVVAYFPIDKLSTGISTSIDNTWEHVSDDSGNSLRNYSVAYSVGPVVRYYLLPVEPRFNLATQVQYSFGGAHARNQGSFGRIETFRAAVIPTYFLNNMLAVEMSIGYESREHSQYDNSHTVFAEVGLQVFLEAK